MKSKTGRQFRRVVKCAGGGALLACAASSAFANASASFSIDSFTYLVTGGALSWSAADDYQTLATTAKDAGGLTGFDSHSASPASGLATASVQSATINGTATAAASLNRTMSGASTAKTSIGPTSARLNSGEMQGTQSGVFSLSSVGQVTFLVGYTLTVSDIGGNPVSEYGFSSLNFSAGNYDTGGGDTQTFGHYSFDTASGTATYRGTLMQTVAMTGASDMGYYQLDGLAYSYASAAAAPAVAAIPEPTTTALMLGGLLGIGGLVRRLRRTGARRSGTSPDVGARMGLRPVATLAVLATSALITAPASAALQDRGNGLVYDTVLDITLAKNANMAAGSSFDDGSSKTDGLMSYAAASSWVSSLVYGGVSGWRLPGLIVSTPDGSCDFGTSGTDCGYNVNVNHSELAYIFTVDLGNQSVVDTNGNPRASYGLKNTGPFTGLSASQFWTGTTFAPNPDRAWNFDMNYGYQTYDFEDRFFYHAWAVHAGDVAGTATPPPVTAVPEPGTWALMVAGLAAIGWTRNRSQSRRRD